MLAAPPQYRFTDSPTGYVSLINRASVQMLEDDLGVPVDPLRFRGNLLVDGLAPFAELDMVGQVIEAPSGLRLKVTKRTVRCAATNVDPSTGLRDLDIPGRSTSASAIATSAFTWRSSPGAHWPRGMI